MYIDSHCHLDLLDVAQFDNGFAGFAENAKNEGIEHMLCISIDLENYPHMRQLVSEYNHISVTVGVHPNVALSAEAEPTVEQLVELGTESKVKGIGETGLDYFRSEGDLMWQKERFRTHIAAARKLKKPLVIHTREARKDTVDILRTENASDAGGVIHCFTEDWDTAKACMDMNFYISFSGIITFKNAEEIREVVKKVPNDRFLIETDSPYLAPTPYRGKENTPLYVKRIAEQIAEIKGMNAQEVAQISRENYYRIFG